MQNKFFLFVICLCFLACSPKGDRKEVHSNDSVINRQSDTTNVIQYFPDGKTIMVTGTEYKKQKFGLWKYYDTAGTLTKALHYFEDSVSFEIDPSELKYHDVILETHRISIPIPDKFISIQPPPGILLAAKKTSGSDSSFTPNITLTVSDGHAGLDSTTVNDYIATLSSQFDSFKLINLEQGPTGSSSRKITYICRKNGIKLGGVSLLFARNNYVFNLSMMAGNNLKHNFLMHKVIFDDLIQRIRFF